MTLEVTEPAPEGDRPTSNDSAATTAPDDNILTAASDTICGRCGGPAAPDGAWCDNCIRECREHTERLDLQRFTELNAGPPEWAAIFLRPRWNPRIPSAIRQQGAGNKKRIQRRQHRPAAHR
jgi:hypothetical protein